MVSFSVWCYVNRLARAHISPYKQGQSGTDTILQNTVVFKLTTIENKVIPLPRKIACFNLEGYCCFASYKTSLNFIDLTVFEYFKQL